MNKLFLVDDDEDDHFFFKEAMVLIDPVLNLDTATNGKIALDKLKTSLCLPDIIFLDLNMPVMNGFDFLIHIKKEKQLNKIPVGILTTSNVVADQELTKELGARFFLTKPNHIQALGKKLKQILSADFSTEEYISIT
ncbi:MAG: response regulator [Rudanella sp.]|nr:response regulator [Rudanella sp.]